MADIKLESDYWETSGIRDITQNKTQRQINDSLQADITDIQSDIGDMDNLDTQATNLVGAANELKGSLNTITPLDTTPTSGSTKGITSGAVYDAIATQTGTPINPIVDASTIEIKKSGKNVYVLVGNVVAVQGTGTWLTYFTLPDGFRPSNTARFFARDLASGAFYNGRVQTGGQVELNIPSGTTANAFFSVSYII